MNDNLPDNNNNFPPDQQKPNQPRFGKSMMFWVMLFGLGFLLLSLLGNLDGAEEVSWTQFTMYAQNGQLEGELTLEPGKLTGTINKATAEKTDASEKFFVTLPNNTEQVESQVTALVEIANKKRPQNTQEVRLKFANAPWWAGILPSLLVMLVAIFILWFFLFRRIGAGGGPGGIMGNFARSKHRVMTKEQSKVTFSDVAGIQEAKDEVTEIVEFLKNPTKFSRLGGRVPRGVLLVGEPGCGKTLLAKAIAGEADVPFFSISGSDFVEMFVGVGASRVRDLFKQAKDSSPCIIFLDEIDAVGRRRGQNFSGGGHDEREQTLNAILVEMDGFGSSDQIIVVAATNRADVLDPALTRPGRFDRQITVPLPDLQGRAEILKIYIDRITTGMDIDLQKLARGTPMFSGADLAALVNEAAIAAAMANKDFVEQAELEEARDKIRWGRSKKSRIIDDKEKEITAYHEAGHTLIQCMIPDADPLHKVSIIPRGPYGGATFSLPEKDRYMYSRRYCLALIQQLMGGRLAEELFCGDISSGASNDIARATELAKKMVLDWGMSENLGFIRYNTDDTGPWGDMVGKEFSDSTAAKIDAEISKIMTDCEQTARKLMEENRDTLERIAQNLMQYETLSADEVHDIIAGKSIDKPTLSNLLDEEQEKFEDDLSDLEAVDAQNAAGKPQLEIEVEVQIDDAPAENKSAAENQAPNTPPELPGDKTE